MVIRKIFIFIILSVVLVSCSNTSTQSPTQTPTPTQVPLSEINLEPVLVQTGDLPAGYSGSQISDIDLSWIDFLQYKGVNRIQQLFEKDGKPSGSVQVILFDEINQVDNSYSKYKEFFEKDSKIIAEDDFSKGELTDIGDKAIYSSHNYLGISTIAIIFTRCNSLVNISFGDTNTLQYISAYAKRLDKRLSELVCR